MSAAKSAKGINDLKSKAKSVLATLEKLSIASNPDREQTRYLCHRLLQLVNNQETSKKDVTSKAGLDVILLTLESCNDQTTCLALVSTLAQLANEGHSSTKRLISHDTTRILMRTLACFGSDLDWRLLSAIISLLSKLGPKDRRFALRARLTGSLPMLLTAVRSTHNHHSHMRLLPAALNVLKLCIINSSTNSNLLGRAGAVNVLCRVCLSLTRKHSAALKTSLATLNLLIRHSKSNASRAITLGLMSQILSLHREYHKSDFRANRHVAIRKSLLNIVKNMAVLKSGRRCFTEATGLDILHASCKDYLAAGCNNKTVSDTLLSVATLILRRCIQKRRLPMTSSHCSFRFHLQGRERSDSLSSTENNIDVESEDDDFDEEDLPISGDNAELEDSEQRRGSSATKLSSANSCVRSPVVRSHDDLKMYEKFFPELTEHQQQEAYGRWWHPEVARPHSSGESPDSAPLHPMRRNPGTRYSYPDLRPQGPSRLPQLNNSGDSPRAASHNWEIPVTLDMQRLNVNQNQATNLQDFGGIQGTPASLVARQPSPRHLTTENGSDDHASRHAPYTAWDFTPVESTDDRSIPPLHLPQITTSPPSKVAPAQVYDDNTGFDQGVSDEHSEVLARIRDVASQTISVRQNPNQLSLADQWGAFPPTKPEPQTSKKFVQRLIKTRILDDVSRDLHPDKLINAVAYNARQKAEQQQSQQQQKQQQQQSKDEYTNGQVYRCEVHQPQDHKTTNGHPTVTIPTGLEHDVTTTEPSRDVILENRGDFGSSSGTVSDSTWPGAYLDEGRENALGAAENLIGAPGGVGRDPATPMLTFDSSFESGNLRYATQVRELEYDLILDSDCNGHHHRQWFYFGVSGMKPGKPYRFNIVNCEKKGSVFNEGMQPVMYSMAEARLGNPCWRRAGKEVCYYRNHFLKNSMSAGGKCRTYVTLTFSVTFQHDDDLCYLAYHYPYTFTKLQMDLNSLLQGVDESSVFVRRQSLCHTLSGNPLPLLTITAQPKVDEFTSHSEAWEELRSRPYIFLSARVHPGESNASWTMLGTLRLLLTPAPGEDSEDLSDDDVTQAAVADELRRSYIFKIVPMLNPDGVINGHHRCSLSGEDLNRTWLDPDPNLFPTIYHTKGLLQYLHSIHKSPLVYCDYHGHSRKMNVFLYGCSHKESIAAGEASTVLDGPDDTGYKALPRLLNHFAPTFSIKNCSFVVEKAKQATARVVVWREMGVARSYTMESTYCGCDQGPYRGKQVSTRHLEDMGAKFALVLLHLKARNRTRGLPVFDIDDEEPKAYSSSSQEAANAEDSGHSQLLLSPGCPVNSDAELTPDEDDLSPVETYMFPSLGTQAFNYYSDEPSSSTNLDAAFWRYDPDPDDGDPVLLTTCRDHEVVDPGDLTSSNSDASLRNRRGHLPVITAKVSPDTGRLLSYEYGERVEESLPSAPRPFESGLSLRREKEHQKPAEESQVPDELLITEGKSARARRRSLKRSQS